MHKRCWYLFAFCCWFLLPAAGISQEIQLKGQFLADSAKIGEPVFYTFTVRYPRELDVLLPDTSFNFAPFEIIEKTYYPTQSDSVYSKDSVVYTLATFELDRIQQLRLPAYVVRRNDSSSVFSEPDSLRVTEMIPVLTDSAAFIETTAYTDVPREFNYPYAIIGTVLALGILIALAWVFGAPIKRQYRIFMLKRSYKRYSKDYQKALAGYEARQEDIRPETLLGIWKNYMEQLEQVPYTKLTTKEIVARQSNGTNLNHILRPIDRGIYGKMSETRMSQSFQELHTVATQRLEAKIREVRHA